MLDAPPDDTIISLRARAILSAAFRDLDRDARDFAAKEPKFAAEVGLVALGRLLNGASYDPEVALVQQAFGHLRDEASRIGARDWAIQQVQALVDVPCHSSRKHFQCVLAQCLARCGE